MIKSAGGRRRLVGKILVAWRDVVLRAGPGRRESLQALREARKTVYDWLGEELVADERD